MDRKQYRKLEVENHWSTPITNVLSMEEWDTWLMHSRLIYERIHRSPYSLVEFHKRAMGRQAYCFTGEFRHWVWEHTTDHYPGLRKHWRVFVSNKKGIGFEVRHNMTTAEALAAWELYTGCMGMDDLQGKTIDTEGISELLDTYCVQYED